MIPLPKMAQGSKLKRMTTSKLHEVEEFKGRELVSKYDDPDQLRKLFYIYKKSKLEAGFTPKLLTMLGKKAYALFKTCELWNFGGEDEDGQGTTLFFKDSKLRTLIRKHKKRILKLAKKYRGEEVSRDEYDDMISRNNLVSRADVSARPTINDIDGYDDGPVKANSIEIELEEEKEKNETKNNKKPKKGGGDAKGNSGGAVTKTKTQTKKKPSEGTQRDYRLDTEAGKELLENKESDEI